MLIHPQVLKKDLKKELPLNGVKIQILDTTKGEMKNMCLEFEYQGLPYRMWFSQCHPHIFTYHVDLYVGKTRKDGTIYYHLQAWNRQREISVEALKRCLDKTKEENYDYRPAENETQATPPRE